MNIDSMCHNNIEANGLKHEKDHSTLLELKLAQAITKTRIQKGLQDLKKSSFTNRNSCKEIIIGKFHTKDKVTNLWSKILSTPCDKEGEKKEKKSVSFSRKKCVRKISHLSNIPDDIIADYWFSSEDIEVMKWEGHFLLYFEERGDNEYVDYDTDSTRGLEHMTEKGTKQLIQNRQRVCNAVLNEQKRQQKEGMNDQFIIAKLYQEANQKYVERALEIAKEDEKAVHGHLSNPSYHRQ